MRIDNQFVVPATPERAWEFLTDLGRVAPCVPGATVESVEGEALTGRVALRIGPMNMTYTGEARFLVKDEVNKVATIEVGGRDGRGGGTVKAKIKARPDRGPRRYAGDPGDRPGPHRPGRPTRAGADQGRELEADAPVRRQPRHQDRASPPRPAGSPVAPAVEAEPINLLDGSLVPKKQLAGAAAGLVALVLAFLLGRSVGRRETR
ncbi:CoxG family protein [Nonomuraea ferruginea]